MRHIAAGCILAFATAGCYNATSTGRIDTRELQRQGADKVTPEQTLLAGIKMQPPAQWSPGKRWRITSDRIAMVLRGIPDTLPTRGCTLVYRGMRQIPGVLGHPATAVELAIEEHPSVQALYMLDTDTLGARQQAAIPFTVDLDCVARADSILRGRTLYVLTSLWTDSVGDYLHARRYIPVKIDMVTPGEPQAPLKIQFHPLYDPSVSASLTIALTGDTPAPRDFASLFDMENPRSRYPDIYPDIWELITMGKVQEGMTREECRLALGQPTETKRQELYSLTREQWSYPSGQYLIFEDGILTKHSL